MSFENPIINKTYSRCFDFKYKWKAALKDQVKLEDGSVAEKLNPQWEFYDYEKKESGYLPPDLKVCVIGVTTQIGGTRFDGNKNLQARYWSNEVLNTFDTPLRVFMDSGSSENKESKKIYDDLYQNFKDEKPAGMSLQINVYFYDFKSKKVGRIELLRSSVHPWFEKKMGYNEDLYKRWLLFGLGEKKDAAGNAYYEPSIELGDSYTINERDEVINSQAYKEYAKWEKGLFEVADDALVAAHTDELEQFEEASAPAPQEDAPINLDDIPF